MIDFAREIPSQFFESANSLFTLLENGIVDTDVSGIRTIIPNNVPVPAGYGGWVASTWKMNGKDSGIFDDVFITSSQSSMIGNAEYSKAFMKRIKAGEIVARKSNQWVQF